MTRPVRRRRAHCIAHRAESARQRTEISHKIGLQEATPACGTPDGVYRSINAKGSDPRSARGRLHRLPGASGAGGRQRRRSHRRPRRHGESPVTRQARGRTHRRGAIGSAGHLWTLWCHPSSFGRLLDYWPSYVALAERLADEHVLNDNPTLARMLEAEDFEIDGEMQMRVDTRDEVLPDGSVAVYLESGSAIVNGAATIGDETFHFDIDAHMGRALRPWLRLLAGRSR